MGLLTIDEDSAESFLAGLEAWEQEAEKRITDTLRGISVALFNYAVLETPQWTGSAASNWNITSAYPSYDMDLTLKAVNKSERAAKRPHWQTINSRYGSPVAAKGDERALHVAVGRNQGNLAAIDMWQPVYITNATEDLTGEAYIRMLEDNPNNYLRPVNEPGHMIARGLAKAEASFAMITPDVEVRLSKLRLGDPTNAGFR